MAIITYLKSDLTDHPPFLYIEDITSKSLEDALHCYTRNSLEYKKAALTVANNHFNLFHYMDNIEKQLNSVSRK